MRRLALFLCLALMLILPLATRAAAPPAAPQAGGAATQGGAEAGSADALIRLLEDEQARAALIARLRQGAAGTSGGAAGTEAGGLPGEPTLARELAERTRDVAERAADGLASVRGALAGVRDGLASLTGPGLASLWALALDVALVAVGLAISYLLLRLVAERLRGWLARRLAGQGRVRRVLAMLAALAVDMVAVLLAWGAGYVLALQVVGGATGRMGIGQTLLLNAFLFVEAVKLLLRAALAPRHPALRPARLTGSAPAYWFRWLKRLVQLLGYTFMFVAPVLAITSPAAAQALRVLALAVAMVGAVLIIMRSRDQLRRAFTARAVHGRRDALSRILALLGQVWHVLAIFYVLALFVVWLVNPREALGFMISATAQSVAAVALGGLVLFLVGRAVHYGVRVPPDVAQRLPLLEGRLRAFLPRVIYVVRTILLVCILALIAQAWQLVDFLGWLSSTSGQRVVGAVVSAVTIVVIGIAIYIAVSSWVEYRLNPDFGSVPTARERTLLSLFRNAFSIALCVIVLMLALAQIGVNIAPLLAGAGVVGLAIGFGAQKFVQDIITGAFIQFEGIMNEGDAVTVGGISGAVERLTIRSVSIRDMTGTVHLIPFSAVDRVSNSARGFGFHVATVSVAYQEDVEQVKAAMQEAFEMLQRTGHGPDIMGPLDMQGLIAFGDSAMTVRARIKTLPGRSGGAGNTYNEILKQVFDAHGIEMANPSRTVYLGRDRGGEVPLPVRVLRRGEGDDTPREPAPPPPAPRERPRPTQPEFPRDPDSVKPR
ncbi:mechanosensitive ion channel domain-containing protein [Pseudoroseomonas globiformis]|uniref:Mechanosensitive ion channel domain-containing protein n=1 Tax=Teichococcus globiformis TaxID=2307229 RepID=A0ABV7G068_9PROT